MKNTEEKQKYKPILLELVNLSASDLITTSRGDDVADDDWT